MKVDETVFDNDTFYFSSALAKEVLPSLMLQDHHHPRPKHITFCCCCSVTKLCPTL